MKPRLTVVEMLYHQRGESDPVSRSVSHARWLQEDEQPYVREMKLDAEWKQLDVGWLKSVSLLVVENLEGRRFDVNPGEAELAKVAEKVVEIAFGDGRRTQWSAELEANVQVLPGESARFVPTDLARVHLRCAAGAKVFLFLVPA